MHAYQLDVKCVVDGAKVTEKPQRRPMMFAPTESRAPFCDYWTPRHISVPVDGFAAVFKTLNVKSKQK